MICGGVQAVHHLRDGAQAGEAVRDDGQDGHPRPRPRGATPPPPPPQRLGVARGGGASVTATRRCAGRGGAGRWVTRGPQTSWWLRRAGRGYAGGQEGGADRGGHTEASHRGGDVEEAVRRRRG